MSETTKALENFLTPSTDIIIGTKTFKMVFDFFAVAEIEEKTGRNLLTEQGWNDLNGRDVSVFFWATLQLHHPDITLVQARRMMNSKNVGLITDKLKHSWAQSKPEAQESDPQ